MPSARGCGFDYGMCALPKKQDKEGAKKTGAKVVDPTGKHR